MTTTPFTTVYADPAWSYGDQLTMSATKRGAASNYPTMSVQEICDLYQSSQVQHVARGRGVGTYVKRLGLLAGHPIADDGFLALWVTKDVLLEGIGQRVANAWGYTPKQIVPWIKGRIGQRDGKSIEIPGAGRWSEIVPHELILQPGMGRIYRNVVEYLLICTRGKYSALVGSHSENGLIFEEEVILEPRSRHSAKPESTYGKIERVCPGEYLELFARSTREGWTSWGYDVGTPRPAAADEPLLPLTPTVHDEPPNEWPT